MFWSPGSGGAGSHEHALDDLTDVTVDYPADGDTLTYDAAYGLWVPTHPGRVTGQDTITDPDTTSVVTHGLDVTPQPGEVHIQPRTISDSTRWAVHTETATEFTVEVAPAPGSGTPFEFAWMWIPST